MEFLLNEFGTNSVAGRTLDAGVVNPDSVLTSSKLKWPQGFILPTFDTDVSKADP
jgi:hypothetical protein